MNSLLIDDFEIPLRLNYVQQNELHFLLSAMTDTAGKGLFFCLDLCTVKIKEEMM